VTLKRTWGRLSTGVAFLLFKFLFHFVFFAFFSFSLFSFFYFIVVWLFPFGHIFHVVAASQTGETASLLKNGHNC
jgi:hypothetical protein